MTKVGEIAARIAREEGTVPAAINAPQDAPKSKKPTRKVGAGLIAALVSVAGTYLADRYGFELDPEQGALITAGLATLVAYLVPERSVR